MTVKELRKALEAYPEDTVVFLYSEVGECDGFIDKITIDKPCPYSQEDIEEGYADENDFFTPHGCNGDSEAESYWYAVGTDKPIVFLHSTNWVHNFGKENA